LEAPLQTIEPHWLYEHSKADRGLKFTRTALLVTAVVSLATIVPAGASGPPTWQTARNVTLPVGGTNIPQGYFPVLACATAANCVAAGDYAGAAGTSKGFVLDEVAGVWKRPTIIVAPHGAAANAGLTPFSAACASANNCVVVGSYQDSTGSQRSFVVGEIAGVWQRATQVVLPTNAVLKGQSSELRAVACAARRTCSAVGTYTDSASPSGRTEGFAVNDVAGVWRHAREVRLPSGANANPFVRLEQLACVKNYCTATGSYIDANNVTQGLIVGEVSGAWTSGVTLSLPADTSAFSNANLSSTTCVAPGYCTAIGTYENVHGFLEGLTVTETRGHWKRAVTMRMPANAAGNPHVFFYGFTGISCPNASNCATGGQYRDSAGNYQGFLLDDGGVVALTCVSVGNCTAGAAYLDGSNNYQAVTANEVAGAWRSGVKIALPAGATTVGVAGGVYGLFCSRNSQCTATGSYQRGANYEGFTVATR
jgi:hypothetical protein